MRDQTVDGLVIMVQLTPLLSAWETTLTWMTSLIAEKGLRINTTELK